MAGSGSQLFAINPRRRGSDHEAGEEKSDRGGEQTITAESMEDERLDVEKPKRGEEHETDRDHEKSPGPRIIERGERRERESREVGEDTKSRYWNSCDSG